MGLLSKLGVVSILALVVLVASATAIPFVASTQLEVSKWLPFLPPFIVSGILFVIAVVSVVGIEGAVITAGMNEGKRKSETELSQNQSIATIILLAISAVAGLYRPTALVGNETLSNILLIVLVLVSGVGGPAALFFLAPYMGKIVNAQRYSDDEWLREAREQFNQSPERQLARAEVDRQTMQVEFECRRLAEMQAAQLEQDKRVQDIQNRQERRDLVQPRVSYPDQKNGNGNGHSNGNGYKINPSTVLDWYMKEMDIDINNQIGSADAVDAYLGAHGIVMDKAESNALKGATRTELSRRRAKLQG